MISDYEIKDCYKEDTIDRKYHIPIVSKKTTTIPKGENSEPMTLKLNEPMSWNEFKELSDSLQRLYIVDLKEKYNVSQGTLAKMFDCVPSTIYNHCKALDIAHLFNKKQMSKPQKEAWKKFLNKRTAEVEKVEKVEEPKITNALPMSYFEIGFKGAFNADNIAATLRKFVADGTNCNIHISFNNDYEG